MEARQNTCLMEKKQKCNPQFASLARLDGSTAVLCASGDQRSITTSQLSFALHLLHAHALRADSWSSHEPDPYDQAARSRKVRGSGKPSSLTFVIRL